MISEMPSDSLRALMKKITLFVSLFLAANALAARIDVPTRAGLEKVESPRKARVLGDARAAFTLDDGSQWITHGAPALREPGAIAVTRFGPDGSARAFIVSDWLPKGSIPIGWCGQVYGVALLDDGRVAVSAGWTDGRSSHNGIFVLRTGPDGGYTSERLIEVPGVARLVGASRNTILAVTTDATRRGGGPLLTLFDTTGRKFGTLFDHDRPISVPEAVQNAAKARLLKVGQDLFAFYDPFVESVIVFEMKVGENDALVSGRRTIFIGDDASTADLPVLGIDVSEDGDILVARVGMVRGTPATQLTLYGMDGLAKQSATVERNLMFREDGRIRGVVMRNGVGLDSVSLRREK